MKKHLKRYLRSKWLWAIVIIAAVIVFFVLRRGPAAPNFEYATAAVGNVVERVSVTGKVSPVGKAGLAFEKSGVITTVNVKVGDRVKKGDIVATLDSAGDRAALASAQATLADVSRSLTPQELSVQQSALAAARSDAVNAAHDSLVKAQDAIFNHADSLFNSPQSANPSINIATQSSAEQLSIDNERIGIGDMFSAWTRELAQASTIDPVTLVSDARGHLNSVKSFLNDLSAIVSRQNKTGSGLSQAQIDAYVATMNAALSTMNAAVDSVTGASAALTSAQSAYDLKLSGNSYQSIAAQSAKVAQAEAELAKDKLVSPMSGIITQADPNVGEFAAAGQSGFSVQDEDYKIEAFVPEADIAKIAIGDLSSTTLDAYGSDTDFPAVVMLIDPAETVLEGVPTYKVTLLFMDKDSRVRSGMTANLDILTHERGSVVAIPNRAVTDDNGSKSVRIVSADGKTYAAVPVATGLKGSDGRIEIVSGVKAGDKVVTYVK